MWKRTSFRHGATVRQPIPKPYTFQRVPAFGSQCPISSHKAPQRSSVVTCFRETRRQGSYLDSVWPRATAVKATPYHDRQTGWCHADDFVRRTRRKVAVLVRLCRLTTFDEAANIGLFYSLGSFLGRDRFGSIRSFGVSHQRHQSSQPYGLIESSAIPAIE